MIYISQSDYDKIIQFARAELPYEACGLIGGSVRGTDKYIDEVYLLTNLDQSSEHFQMDPKEQLQAVKDMRTRGLVLLGNFHSHPETPSRPSQEDIRLAYDPEASYLILSLAEEAPVLHSFHIENGEVSKERIEIKAL